MRTFIEEISLVNAGDIINASNGSEIFLGVSPLESMDIYDDPVNQRLVSVHGDRRIHRLK